LLSHLAEQAVGYCGSDLRALCSEAVIQGLRRRYPQIYKSSQKLLLDPNAVKVSSVLEHMVIVLTGLIRLQENMLGLGSSDFASMKCNSEDSNLTFYKYIRTGLFDILLGVLVSGCLFFFKFRLG
jgi:hypothetical protein